MSIQNSEEQHHQGDFLRIPQVRPSSSIAYLVVNCVIPGLGTVIASWTDVTYPHWDWAVFITGILQFGLAWIIIGWAWSIWWGVRMYQDSQTRKLQEEEYRPPPINQDSSLSPNPSEVHPSSSMQSNDMTTDQEKQHSTHVTISAEEIQPGQEE